jgi:hypothetical protein
MGPIGFKELVVILIVVLLVFGAEEAQDHWLGPGRRGARLQEVDE